MVNKLSKSRKIKRIRTAFEGMNTSENFIEQCFIIRRFFIIDNIDIHLFDDLVCLFDEDLS